jgi:hypothetical protein
MIDLYKYISELNEGLLAGQDVHLAKDVASELLITEWIKEHYRGMGPYEVENSEALDIKHDWNDLSFRDEKASDGRFIVDFKGNLEFYSNDRDKLKTLTNDMFVWGNVDGSFTYNAYNGKLETLEGAPMRVGRRFTCNGVSKLKTLEGAPEYVGGGFNCNLNRSLTSLKGCPKFVGGHFAVAQNAKLKKLDYMPDHIGTHIYLNNCKSLESIEGLPNVVNGSLYINGCENLESLKGCPVEINGKFCFDNCKKLTSLDGMPKKVAGAVECRRCGTKFQKSEIRSLCQVSGIIDAYGK